MARKRIVKPGTSERTVDKNIATEVRRGASEPKAVAIALHERDASRKRENRAARNKQARRTLRKLL